MTAAKAENTRASARARDRKKVWTVERVTVPPGSAELRCPVVLVHVRMGALVLSVAVSKRQRQRIEVRFPTLPGTHADAVRLPPRMAAKIHEAAMQAALAEPEARRLLQW